MAADRASQTCKSVRNLPHMVYSCTGRPTSTQRQEVIHLQVDDCVLGVLFVSTPVGGVGVGGGGVRAVISARGNLLVIVSGYWAEKCDCCRGLVG